MHPHAFPWPTEFDHDGRLDEENSFADWMGIKQAVAQCKAGQGLIKVNGRPLQLVEPAILRTKVRLFAHDESIGTPHPWKKSRFNERGHKLECRNEKEEEDAAGIFF